MDRLRPTLVIVCGLPGTGKTTHARRLESEMHAVRFCPDEWMQALGVALDDGRCRSRVEALQWAQARRLLAHGQSVLIEWGTWGRGERGRIKRGRNGSVSTLPEFGACSVARRRPRR